MKFCKKRLYNFNDKASTHYITDDDVLNFHGKLFHNQFKEFIKLKPKINIDNNDCYFYVDYEFAARQTDSFLYPQG